MAYQAAKFDDIKDKINILLWMEQLEFNLLDLPRPDKVIFLYLPYEYRLDQNEDNKHLKNAEKAYNLITERYSCDIVNCIKDDKIRTIEDIHEEVYNIVKEML